MIRKLLPVVVLAAVILGAGQFFTTRPAYAVSARALVIDGVAVSETAVRDVDDSRYIDALVLKERVYSNVSVDTERRLLVVRQALPRVRFTDTVINELLFSPTAFNLPLRYIDGAFYVDIEQAAAVLGFVIEERDGAVIVRTNQYSAFAPYTFAAGRARRLPAGAKVNLVWQPNFQEVSNMALQPVHNGVNVVSPSFFAITGEDGDIVNKADRAYVDKLHAKGYQVWALITNSFNADLTSRILGNEKAQAQIVKQLLVYSELYDLDGINFDFENIHQKDRDKLSRFVEYAGQYLRRAGLTVSMDVTLPTHDQHATLSYDWRSLGGSVDYLILMAYDEHWRTSPVSGSVASIGWVENGIKNTLKMVDPAKVVLGVPLYMRLWQEHQYTGEVKPTTLSMPMAETTIREKNLTPVWLEDKGQYYFEYYESPYRYRVWQEDERSLALKLELVAGYGLAGTAAWRKGFEMPAVWDMMAQKLAALEKPPAEADDTADVKQRKGKKDKKRRRD